MSDLYRLVYASRNLLEGTAVKAQAAVDGILAASRRNNPRAGVTGALMFNNGAFAQVLEGPQKGVEDTFERIQRDTRHGNVTVLEYRQVRERAFPEWSMAFVGRSESGLAAWNGLATESGFDLRRLDGDAVFSMLHSLLLEEESLFVPPPASPGDLTGAGPEGADKPDAPPGDAVPDSGEKIRPEQSRPSDPARAAEGVLSRFAGDAAAIAILKAAFAILKVALAEERGHTTVLRAELDAMRVSLTEAEGRLALIQQQRDQWRTRARMLTSALCEDGDEAAGRAAVPPRAAPRPSPDEAARDRGEPCRTKTGGLAS